MKIAPNFTLTLLASGILVEVNQHMKGANVLSSHQAGFLLAEAHHDERVEWTPEMLANVQTRAQTLADHLFAAYIRPIPQANNAKRIEAMSGVMTRFNIMINESVADNEAQDVALEVFTENLVIEKKLSAIAYAINPNTGTIPRPTDPVTPVEPEPEPELEEGDTVMFYSAAISPQFLTSSGNLLAGTGIPGQVFSVARNDLLELAITAYKRTAYADRTIDEDTISFVLPNSGNAERWSIAWSAGLLVDAEYRLTDLYNISLVLNTHADGSRSDETAILFDMIWRDGQYVLVERNGVTHDTVDSVSDANFLCVQNSTDYHWFKTLLIPAFAPTESVVGNFVIELRAVNKRTNNVVSVIADVFAENAIVV